MRKTNENTFTLEIASKQSIATGSITITETPTTNMTLGLTSHETTTSGLWNFEKLNRFEWIYTLLIVKIKNLSYLIFFLAYFFTGNGSCILSYRETPFRCARGFPRDSSTRLGCERYCTSYKACIGYTSKPKSPSKTKHIPVSCIHQTDIVHLNSQRIMEEWQRNRVN